MSDQKKPEFEVEEVQDTDLEGVSGGGILGGDACDGCEGCDGCATKPTTTRTITAS